MHDDILKGMEKIVGTEAVKKFEKNPTAEYIPHFTSSLIFKIEGTKANVKLEIGFKGSLKSGLDKIMANGGNFLAPKRIAFMEDQKLAQDLTDFFEGLMNELQEPEPEKDIEEKLEHCGLRHELPDTE